MAADQNGQGNDGNDMIWMLVGLAAIAVIGWIFGRAAIVKGAFYLWSAEIWVASLFTDDLSLLTQWMDARWDNPKDVTFMQFIYLASNIGNYTGVLTMLILCGMAGWLMFKMPEEKYKRKFTMLRLAHVQAKQFPFILPALDKRLVQEDPTKGPWASAQTELEFSRKNKLLKPDGSIDRARAEKVFAAQLGRSFEGISRLRDYEKALFALFCARACFDQQGADVLVRQFAESITKKGKIDISGIDAVIEKCRKNPEWKKVRKVTGKHAFVTTFMCSMLQVGRQSGVLQPAQFLWLKPMDRNLWYSLHQMEPPSTSTLPGQLIRKRVWAETAGVRAHWIAEKFANRPLMMPIVTEAVNGLELAVNEFEIVEEEKD